MKRLFIVLIFCFVLSLTACNIKAKEEALAQTTEAVSELGEITFTLDGYWSLKQGEKIEGMNLSDSQTCDLSASHTETDTSINIIYDDLAKTEGGTLVRTDDYVNAVWESLKNSSDYTYYCSEISSVNLHGKEYQTFSAKVAELEGVQHFYIRRVEDTMMIMIITLYAGDSLEEIINLSR